eukprot:CAMPEP_0175099750 /NCGR_PEP_ID=MMETSP0086_2-20121207/6641_1 /TAXON_ID=136419 /ORGANISM="Unknown Unknown, Strain D1" /LENGTH=185 /DNA_ID=CAMNT_0016373657 /DNA_START=168 /DNA_END=721 /DNA_ORIENTATION=-
MEPMDEAGDGVSDFLIPNTNTTQISSSSSFSIAPSYSFASFYPGSFPHAHHQQHLLPYQDHSQPAQPILTMIPGQQQPQLHSSQLSHSHAPGQHNPTLEESIPEDIIHQFFSFCSFKDILNLDVCQFFSSRFYTIHSYCSEPLLLSRPDWRPALLAREELVALSIGASSPGLFSSLSSLSLSLSL